MSLEQLLAHVHELMARWRRRRAAPGGSEEWTDIHPTEITSPFVTQAAALRFGDLLLYADAYRRVDELSFDDEQVHVRFAGGLEHSYRSYDRVTVTAP